MPEERGEIDAVSWSVGRKTDLQRSTSGGKNMCGSNIDRSTLGATDPFLHSDSNEGSTAGFRTAVRMIFRAIVQFCSCFSGNEEAKSPNAILLFDTAIAGSRKGSSISTRKRILCLISLYFPSMSSMCPDKASTIYFKAARARTSEL
ncbi:hypothetical protein V8G54_009168 [Vigna mungo]|uniref:Uncharacterized protein n=1 Tax=Vigna mungo TaxID=3915 RepID=A0AAQ3S574_VIGMU